MELNIKEEISRYQGELISWRRYLHQHPELSFKEFKTAAYLETVLKSFSDELIVTRPTATSVVAYLRGGKPGKTTLLRADIDGLPVTEEVISAYQSVNPGVMHACGHDGHMAILLTVIKILVPLQAQLKGQLIFVFQAGEEVGGSRKLLETGLLRGVDQAFALHLWSPLETGKYGIGYGPMMAAGDAFTIEILGKGGHAGRPQETIDPISVGINLISTVQQLISRKVDPIDPNVFSVTLFQGGNNNNVIPEKVKIGGTIRTLDTELLADIRQYLKNSLVAICGLHGADYTIRFETDKLRPDELPSVPVTNNQETTKRVETAIRKYLGQERIQEYQPTLAGEDFAFYSVQVPSTFVFVGTKNSALETDYPHHHPKFKLDEASLADGVALFLAIIKEVAWEEA